MPDAIVWQFVVSALAEWLWNSLTTSTSYNRISSNGRCAKSISPIRRCQSALRSGPTHCHDAEILGQHRPYECPECHRKCRKPLPNIRCANRAARDPMDFATMVHPVCCTSTVQNRWAIFLLTTDRPTNTNPLHPRSTIWCRHTLRAPIWHNDACNGDQSRPHQNRPIRRLRMPNRCRWFVRCIWQFAVRIRWHGLGCPAVISKWEKGKIIGNIDLLEVDVHLTLSYLCEILLPSIWATIRI